MTAPTKAPAPKIRHEEFCQPTGDRTEVRIESYFFYEDDPRGGRSRATHQIHRCIECGIESIKKIGD